MKQAKFGLFVGSAGMSKTYSLLSVLPVKLYEQNSGNDQNQIKEHIDDGQYTEGGLKEVVLSIHERNPVARKKCIEYYGTRCFVCKMQFAERYGPLFADLIHVHHRTPLQFQNEEYTVDPILDLIPVCPNCHMILHSKKDGVYTPEEVIAFMHSQNQ